MENICLYPEIMYVMLDYIMGILEQSMNSTNDMSLNNITLSQQQVKEIWSL